MPIFRRFAAVLALALAATCLTAAPAQAIRGGEYADSSRGLAAIHYYGGFVCTGSIVDNYWILTAKHCLYENGSRRADSGFTIRVKSLYRSSGGGVLNVVISKVRDNHDVAMMKMDRSANAEPVRLAGAHPKQYTVVYVFGWGRTCETCSASERLKRAEQWIGVPLFDEDTYGGLAIFATWETGAPCRGDSGGPLFKLVDGDRYQVGLNSRGPADCSGTGDKYASVPESLDWINRVMELY